MSRFKNTCNKTILYTLLLIIIFHYTEEYPVFCSWNAWSSLERRQKLKLWLPSVHLTYLKCIYPIKLDLVDGFNGHIHHSQYIINSYILFRWQMAQIVLNLFSRNRAALEALANHNICIIRVLEGGSHKTICWYYGYM